MCVLCVDNDFKGYCDTYLNKQHIKQTGVIDSGQSINSQQ